MQNHRVAAQTGQALACWLPILCDPTVVSHSLLLHLLRQLWMSGSCRLLLALGECRRSLGPDTTLVPCKRLLTRHSQTRQRARPYQVLCRVAQAEPDTGPRGCRAAAAASAASGLVFWRGVSAVLSSTCFTPRPLASFPGRRAPRAIRRATGTFKKREEAETGRVGGGVRGGKHEAANGELG